MLEKLPHSGEPDSVKIGRIGGLATLVIGEGASVVGAIATHSSEVFAGGTALTIGASLLAAAKVPKIFDRG